MSAEITRINPEYKEASLPDVLQHIENSDASFVIHLKDGVWTLQVAKGYRTAYELIGILQCVSDSIIKIANRR